ncbi:MAG: hypothetical protein E6Q97_24985 [Desulfurellales bacterium]|nr:MAG: hypothetical protein E6Q97_24985 [Desulfurellales bacterium]
MIESLDISAGSDFDRCKEAAEVLHNHYPGHAWAVHPQGGCLVIRNLVISELYGMVLHMDNLTDGGARKKRIIRAGGEYLERAGWKRGRYEGQDRPECEGVKRGSR